MTNNEEWNRFAKSFLKQTEYIHSTFDLPAMPLNWYEANLIIVIHNSMITLTQCTMHGRRVLDVRCSSVSSSIKLSAFQATGGADTCHI